MAFSARIRVTTGIVVTALAVGLTSEARLAVAQEAAAVPAKKARDPVEKLSLETSDGVTIAAWHYRVPEETDRPPVVILLHDLDGSHTTVIAVPRRW